MPTTIIDLSTPGPGVLAILGAADYDTSGCSVKVAGDVNQDGFDDIIIGAYGNDGGATQAGAAYVVFGRERNGLTSPIALASLAPADGFMIQGDAASDEAGRRVATAGDINGDGYADLIVGAWRGDDGGTEAGEAYVIFGKASGFATIDLGALSATDGFIIQGDAAGDQAGYSVASAGDINGDGYDDLIVGAPFGDDGGSLAGEAYVIFGKAAGFTNIDLSSLALADGFIIQGDAADDRTGCSVASAGDINGDGFDDLIVGASTGDNGGINAGEAYVIFGKPSAFANIDLTTLATADGFIIQGPFSGSRTGFDVASAGDINRDGFDDIIVGAPFGTGSPGDAYVIFGKSAGFANINLASLAPADGFLIQGDGTVPRVGFSVSSAGDFNGDGYDELIIGAPYGTIGGAAAGEAYLIYGKAGGFTTIDLANLDSADGFILTGDLDDRVGGSVSGAGDVDGDGFDDLIVGARFNDTGGNNRGTTYIVFGYGAGDFPSFFDLADDVTPASGFVIQGDAANDQAGRSVASAGDVNGDGYDDLIVGARFGDDGGTNAGEAYVIFGRAGDPGTIDLTGLAPADGFIIQGDAANDEAGYSVASAGDINGDGYSDLIVGARFGDNGGANAGEAYVIFGKSAGFATIDLTTLGPADGFVIQGDLGGDSAGFSVSSAGDVNDDGFDDLIVGAPLGNNGGADAGEAYVLFGKASGFANIDLTGLAATDGFIIQGDVFGDHAGSSVSSAGDFNGDGFADLVIGAPYSDPGGGLTGEAYVVFGKASGFGTIDLTGLAATDGFLIQGDALGDRAGCSVSAAGDVNGDGFGDIIVGAKFGDNAGTDAGEAYVIFGKASGFGTIDLTTLAVGAGFIIQGPAAGSYTGYSVSGAGDVNGDGFDDLLVGASGGDLGGTDNGLAFVIFGKASGFSTVDLANLSQADGFTIQGQSSYDRAGRSVSAAGDVNGDGFDDLLVGAPYGDLGGNAAGQAYVIYGRGPSREAERTGSLIDQVIHGGAFDDFLDGAGGDDLLLGEGGNDVLVGGSGSNSLDGSDGSDTADFSGAGASVEVDIAAQEAIDNGQGGSDAFISIENATGSAFADILLGSTGANVLDGSGGVDQMTGLAGNDTYVVDSLLDQVIENASEGSDTINAAITYTLGTNFENLTLTGTGNISGTGNSANNVLTGNDGNNVLTGGGGSDDLAGGLGSDIYFVDSNGDIVSETSGLAEGGTDLVHASISYTLTANVENLILDGTASISGFGNGLNNIITGNIGNNGLDGGAGADSLRGGDGNDIYTVDTVGDIVIEVSALGGTDLVNSSITFILGGNVENLTLTGTTNINGTGNTQGNIITGNSGANTLNGGAGIDSLRGGDGDDFYQVDDVGDLVIETNAAAAGGIDTVQSSITFILGGNVENLTLNGTAANGTGNTLNNIINGNGQANTLNGGAGADTMSGGLGDDTYQVDNVGDQAIETTAGGGVDTVLSSVTFTLGIHVDNLSLTGSAAINGTGNDANNVLTGNGADNVLDGGIGQDTINAGNGADTLRGGSGNDTLNASTGNDDLYGGIGIDTLSGSSGNDDFFFDTTLNPVTNVDAITDFSAVFDTIFLDDAVFTAIAAGTLAAGAFQSGAVALDADDRILYDVATGQIRYDADGVGGAGATLFATVTAGLVLTNADFVGY